MLLHINKSTGLNNINYVSSARQKLSNLETDEKDRLPTLKTFATCSIKLQVYLERGYIGNNFENNNYRHDQYQHFTSQVLLSLRVFGSLFSISLSVYFVWAATFLQISLVYSLHFAVPPRSPVKYLPSLIVS